MKKVAPTLATAAMLTGLTAIAHAQSTVPLPYTLENISINGQAPVDMTITVADWGGDGTLHGSTDHWVKVGANNGPSSVYVHSIAPESNDLNATSGVFDMTISFSEPTKIGSMSIANAFQNNQYEVSFEFDGGGAVLLTQWQNYGTGKNADGSAYTGTEGYHVTQTGSTFLFDSLVDNFNTNQGQQGSLFQGQFRTSNYSVTSIRVRGVHDSIEKGLGIENLSPDDIEFFFPKAVIIPEPSSFFLTAFTGAFALLYRRRSA